MPLLVLVLALFVTNQAPATAPQDPQAHARVVLGRLTSGDFAGVEAEFTDQMKAALPVERLSATWTGLLAQAGAFKSCSDDSRLRRIADKEMVITACQFEHAKIDVQFAFDANGRIAGLAMRPAAAPPVPYTPPSYAPPSAYTERDVTVGSGEWALPGTLTLPTGDGPFPAVVLVHGSGPNDRDETVGANKPFADLALGLASRGVAVLRYDKRSKVHGAKMAALAGMTVKDEVVDDALLAVALLRTQPKIDPARVFVLGHSLGGMLIPRIAAADAKLAGAIVMAGAARPLEQAIAEQTKYLANADGSVSAQEQAQIDETQKLTATIAALTPQDASSTRVIFGAPASYWLDLRGYDPPSAAKALTMPRLVLQGERDYQVTMDDFERWRAALGNRPGVTFRTYASLNHLFIAGTGKSLPAEYDVASHVAEQVIQDIAAWIKR